MFHKNLCVSSLVNDVACTTGKIRKLSVWQKLKYYGFQQSLVAIFLFPRPSRTTVFFEFLKKNSYRVPTFGYLLRWRGLIENGTRRIVGL